MTAQTFREATQSWLKQPGKVAGAVQDPHDANLLGQLPKKDQVAAVHNDPQPRRDIGSLAETRRALRGQRRLLLQLRDET